MLKLRMEAFASMRNRNSLVLKERQLGTEIRKEGEKGLEKRTVKTTTTKKRGRKQKIQKGGVVA